MTNRENYLSIGRRQGYEYMPVHLDMCPSLRKRFDEYVKDHDIFIPLGHAYLSDTSTINTSPDVFLEKYYHNRKFAPGTTIDRWGVAREPSPNSFHMSYMYHPMENFDSVEQIESYHFPVFSDDFLDMQIAKVQQLHNEDRAVIGKLDCTVWETSWYMRGMENLMCDMLTDAPMAEALLDRVTDISSKQAIRYAQAGVDALLLGDDVGMQFTTMMSEEMYLEWLNPRLKKVIDAARSVNPEIMFIYHSCGHVTEFIPHFISAGIDVLDPVQPECMDFNELHEKYKDQISFRGTIGTQTVIPFGTPEEVRAKVFENLDIAGKKGGLYVCPTHLLEPEVPVENVVAYIQACIDYTDR